MSASLNGWIFALTVEQRYQESTKWWWDRSTSGLHGRHSVVSSATLTIL